MNYYEILEVSPKASEQAISISYKALMKKYSSSDYDDNRAFAEKKLEELNDAYLVLSDKVLRSKYDKNGFMVSESTAKKEKINEPIKSRWENFWFYHKWHTFASVFIVIVLIVSIRSCVTRINPDLSILFIASNSLMEQDKVKLQENIANYVEDYTLNKKVEVEISNIMLNQENSDPQMGMAMQQKFIAEVSVGDTIFYMCDKESIENFTKNGMLANIEAIANGKAQAENTLIKITNPKFYEGLSEYAPKELYIGIRTYDKAQVAKDKNKQLKLERVIEIIKRINQ